MALAERCLMWGLGATALHAQPGKMQVSRASWYGNVDAFSFLWVRPPQAILHGLSSQFRS